MRVPILGGRFVAPSVLLTLASGCAAAGGPSPLDLTPVPQAVAAPPAGAPRLQLLPAERAYVADTASVIYRRRPADRTRDFIFADERGFGLCLRSPVKGGGYDHTLLILQRRIAEDFIPQAADDVVVLRASADVSACKRPLGSDNAWIKVR